MCSSVLVRIRWAVISRSLSPHWGSFWVCSTVRAAPAPADFECCPLSTQVCGPQPKPQGSKEQWRMLNSLVPEEWEQACWEAYKIPACISLPPNAPREVFVQLRAGGYRGNSADGIVCWVNCSVWSEALRGCRGKWGVWSGFSSSKVFLTAWTGEERKKELAKREERKSMRTLLGSAWGRGLICYEQISWGNRESLRPG